MNPAVDRDTATQRLELANKHVLKGQERVEAQLALVAKLERGGHNTHEAKMLLDQFEQILALQIETRDRMVQGLGENK